MYIRCPDSTFLKIGCRKGWKLVFDGYSADRKGAVVNALPSENDILWGALYEISGEDLKLLDTFEDYPNSYQREKVAIQCSDNIKVFAHFYFRKSQKAGNPSKEYLDIVLQGAKECGLPEEYIEKYIAHVQVSIKSDQDAYNQLAYYTLSHQNPSFIHQHLVDAFAAQTATQKTKPIALTFALAGLYLYLKKGFTGRQVQLMHMKMAKYKREWLTFDLPEERGEVTVHDVLAILPGSERDEKIRDWCISVWEAYRSSHKRIENIMREYLR